MNFFEAIGTFGAAAGFTTAAIAATVWLLRTILSSAIAESVRGDVEAKLEEIRSDFRAREIELQNRLTSQGREIEDVRTSALDALTKRQVAIDSRRLKAIDDIWKAIQDLKPMANVANTISVVDHQAASDEVSKNPKFQEVIDLLGAGYDPSIEMSKDAILARPHVTPMAWALYSAYHRICGIGVLKWEMTRKGIYNPNFIKEEGTKCILIAALPEKQSAIEDMNEASYPHLLEELEEKLLRELQRMIDGTADSFANVERAAEIMQKTSEAVQAVSKNTRLQQNDEAAT